MGPFAVEPVPVDHPVTAYALRVTADGADPGATPATPARARGSTRPPKDADLLLAEASFREGDDRPRPDLHLTGARWARPPPGRGVARLVLTHVPPWHEPERALDEAQTSWDGPLDLAVAGATYLIGP